ncbi:MAG: protein translocase subunit SecD [Candidatus Adiutrix sp.]|jgi:preprotein translocase subunit SecD|nr:protein translocase subunit SecD [Candidatus Adiutrix sp.]
MDKSLKWRLAVVGAVLLASAYCVLPTFTEGLPAWWTHKKISLGLDLKGGIHLVMGADLNVVVENSAVRAADEFRRALAEDNVKALKVAKGPGLTIEAEFPDDGSLTAARALLEKKFSNLAVTARDGLKLTLGLTPAEVAYTREMTARQALETIRNRVDMFGVAEPDIRPQGEDRIVIQLPGLDDPKRAVALIGKTALLEFKLVDEAHTAEWALTNGVPVGMEVLYEREVSPEGQERRLPYLLKKAPLMTGEGLVDARVTMSGRMGEPEVAIAFDSRGARTFERITGEYVRRRMAIVLDGVVYSAPVIQTKIAGGRAVISGSGDVDEARDLAVALRAGALPAPVSVLEERTVGPTLGADSIEMGYQAGLVGLGAVLLFMAFYYRKSGLVADAALLFNFPIILAVLAVFGASLTLPGIFGLILTLGMAVDANVLIFERIREELRAGKTPRAAVSAGFGRAFWTIFDSNLTTLITAIVLYQFGSGPIRGFAVTLSVGILSSMFTAIFFSRVVFDLMLSGRRPERLSI